MERSRNIALRRRFQATSEPDERIRRKIYFKRELTKYKRTCIETKMATFRDRLDKIVVVNTFDSFYRLIDDRFSTSRDLVQMLNDNGQEIDTHSKIREYILKFHFPPIDDDEILSVQSDKISEFDLFTEEEIFSIFEDCKNDKSPGPDGLTMGITKEIFFDNKSLFINLLNLCLYKGIFPKVWKRANVALIPKSGKDLRLPNNYRSICLLPVWGKVLDKILAKRLSYFLEQNNKLHDLQFGFRKDRNTFLPLHEVINTITTNKNNNLLTAMISLDISNAFNSVRWSDIIRILFEEEVPEYLIKMIRDFLSDRFIVDEENCFEFQYNVGVLQGSCLDPILFLLIADRLLRDLNTDDKTKVIMFADDILILIADSAVYRFSESTKIPLHKVSLWAENHRLKINPLKSVYTVFIKKLTRRPQILFQQSNIKFSSEIKYLGIVIDHNLSWIPHLNYLKKKSLTLQNKLIRFCRATWGVESEVVKEIYLRVTERILMYGSEIWYRDTAIINRKIQSLQCNALRNITKTYKTVSTLSIQVLAGIPP
ncbi:Putative protein in type-1 retrotransposable element R1DM [Araneus ventricosus]|uniref:Reverse transcriptase domain-containing protein n=1 Tax=Araneus ventricosus TaxID=182803 RepID=A0A4Y2TER9_ARAVE|nr:Putative protein in type-1 retrotransposable element R1DM [Araneus ventricosus]